MKKIIITVILVLVSVGLAACGDGVETESDGELNIVTTVFPAYDFARAVAGERGSVTLLVPPGTESHSFEPTPQDIVLISRCDLLICNGGESEAWLEKIIGSLDTDVKMLSMLECVDALEEEIIEGMQHTEENEEAQDETEYDEHVWTSPVNAQIICRAICTILCETDPENSGYYIQNTDNYCTELDELDRQFREISVSAERNVLVFADRFPVRYFTEEYGLEYFAAFPGCAEDAEPSARTVAFLIDRVRENNIPAVLYIEFSNQKMADVVCEDTGCEKLEFHSCHNVSAGELEGGITYLELMRRNLDTIREALN